jgi:mRNA interferase MazF
MKRLSQPLFRPLPDEPGETEALCAWGVVSNEARKRINVRSHGDRSARNKLMRHDPHFCAINQKIKGGANMREETRPIRRGEVYYADLNPVVGSEQGGVRPVLILQNNIGNRYSPTIIAAAITGRPKKLLPTHVLISCVSGLHKDSFVLLEQIRTLDRGRLQNYSGSISSREMEEINEALAISVGLDPALY